MSADPKTLLHATRMLRQLMGALDNAAAAVGACYHQVDPEADRLLTELRPQLADSANRTLELLEVLEKSPPLVALRVAALEKDAS